MIFDRKWPQFRGRKMDLFWAPDLGRLIAFFNMVTTFLAQFHARFSGVEARPFSSTTATHCRAHAAQGSAAQSVPQSGCEVATISRTRGQPSGARAGPGPAVGSRPLPCARGWGLEGAVLSLTERPLRAGLLLLPVFVLVGSAGRPLDAHSPPFWREDGMRRPIDLRKFAPLCISIRV